MEILRVDQEMKLFFTFIRGTKTELLKRTSFTMENKCHFLYLLLFFCYGNCSKPDTNCFQFTLKDFYTKNWDSQFKRIYANIVLTHRPMKNCTDNVEDFSVNLSHLDSSMSGTYRRRGRGGQPTRIFSLVFLFLSGFFFSSLHHILVNKNHLYI